MSCVKLLVCLVTFFMRSVHSWISFPTNLDSSSTRSLSLLFVLQECLVTFQLLEQIEDAILNEPSHITSCLNQLLLFSLDGSFLQKSGSLDKLCFYFEVLLEASKIKEGAILDLLEGMRNTVIKIRSKWLVWEKRTLIQNEIIVELSALQDDLRKKLLSVFSALYVFIHESYTDENVLLYLVENRLQFNHHVGPQTIERLLISFFPTSSQELRAVICAGYARRGFDSFYAKQKAILDTIKEWEANPCLSPSQKR